MRARAASALPCSDQHGRFPQRDALRACLAAHFVQRAVADATGGRVDRALEGGVIVAVGQQAQVGQCVLDFGTLEEAHATVHAVRHLFAQQRFFQRARLRVAAVEHGHFGVAATIAHPLAGTLDDVARLVHLVVRGVQVDRLAVAAVGPQLLADAIRVVRDHRIGGTEDVGGGAVVLFQADGLRAREVAQEALHVLDLGTAPTVDGLVIVANHEHVAGIAGQHAHEGVLDGIGVLELVHQDFAEARAVVRQQGRVVTQQFVRAQQQFGEVDQAGAVAARLVLDVGLAHGFQPRVVRFGLDVLRAAAFVLLRVDPPRDLLGRVFAVVQFQRLHHALDQPQLIVRVHHLEAFGQLRVLPVQAQQAVGQAVEGTDPHATAAIGQLCVDAVAHLAGRLVGEGHRENAVGRHAIDFMQPGNAVGKYAGLAGTGTGQHQVVAGGAETASRWAGFRPSSRWETSMPPFYGIAVAAPATTWVASACAC